MLLLGTLTLLWDHKAERKVICEAEPGPLDFHNAQIEWKMNHQQSYSDHS